MGTPWILAVALSVPTDMVAGRVRRRCMHSGGGGGGGGGGWWC